MRQLLMTLFALGMVACAGATDGILYQSFVEYRNTLKSETVASEYPLFFSRELIGDVSVEDPDTQSQLLFHKSMKKEIMHFEERTGEHGCLTINGTDHNGAPMAFNLQYIKEQERWLIRSINLFFPLVREELPTKASCP